MPTNAAWPPVQGQSDDDQDHKYRPNGDHDARSWSTRASRARAASARTRVKAGLTVAARAVARSPVGGSTADGMARWALSLALVRAIRACE
jgi:hypothetical protein